MRYLNSGNVIQTVCIHIMVQLLSIHNVADDPIMQWKI